MANTLTNFKNGDIRTSHEGERNVPVNSMLQDLPVEVLAQVIGHLPTATSVANLSLSSHKFHSLITANENDIFRSLVQRKFPTIDTPHFWKDVARVLTSRSRAWDRRAFIARECYPPGDDVEHPQGGLPIHTVGYHPAIDSYETWLGGAWSSRKEVLAWGAAGRLRIRTIKDGMATWSSYRTPEDHMQHLDILDVRTLRPHQQETPDTETIVFQRANRKIVKVETADPDVFTQKSRYAVPPGDFVCMDINKSADPVLVVCGDHGISLYPVHSTEKLVQPTHSVELAEKYAVRSRMRCVKFLSDTTVATTNQLLHGPFRPQIQLYDIRPSGLSSTPLVELMNYSQIRHPAAGRHNANVIMTLEDTIAGGRNEGQLFLSGWSDGIARLYDTRVPRTSVAEYVDTVDDGQILSLLTVGHERFVAGSSQNGCLRMFDLRIPGAKPYSYLDAQRPQSARELEAEPLKGVNIFLTPTVNFGERLWEPLPRNPRKRSYGYRGSVYSLSSPSPCSPTVYAGIENHVLQLDFASTDDVRQRRTTPSILNTSTYPADDKTRAAQQHILNLSCYERPREGKESTDPVLLRKQLDFAWALKYGIDGSGVGSTEKGWDERLRLNTSIQERGNRNVSGDWRTSRRQPV